VERKKKHPEKFYLLPETLIRNDEKENVNVCVCLCMYVFLYTMGYHGVTQL